VCSAASLCVSILVVSWSYLFTLVSCRSYLNVVVLTINFYWWWSWYCYWLMLCYCCSRDICVLLAGVWYCTFVACLLSFLCIDASILCL
jgi:hypothetical protein